MSLFDKSIWFHKLMHYRDATPLCLWQLLHAVNGHSMTNVPDGMEIALFAMGCFWGVERLFWQLRRLQHGSGYTGGYTPNQPTAKSAPAKPAMRKRYA